MKDHEKILESMRRRHAGWSGNDFDRLYAGFGFAKIQGKRHTIYKHPIHGDLWVAITRSSGELSQAYAREALKTIGELKKRNAAEN